MKVAEVFTDPQSGDPCLRLTSLEFQTFSDFEQAVRKAPEEFAGKNWTLVAERPIVMVEPFSGFRVNVEEPTGE